MENAKLRNIQKLNVKARELLPSRTNNEVFFDSTLFMFYVQYYPRNRQYCAEQFRFLEELQLVVKFSLLLLN